MKTYADHQAKVKFSYKKYYSFRNRIHTKFSERFYSDMQIERVTNALFYGDTQPALVVSTEPLLVAAYSDEMDAVTVLRFPSEFCEKYQLTEGTRLTTSNVYFEGEHIASDIFIGEGYLHRWTDYMSVVQLFIGKGDDKIRAKVALFGEDIWERVALLAQQYVYEHPSLFRDGFCYLKK